MEANNNSTNKYHDLIVVASNLAIDTSAQVRFHLSGWVIHAQTQNSFKIFRRNVHIEELKVTKGPRTVVLRVGRRQFREWHESIASRDWMDPGQWLRCCTESAHRVDWLRWFTELGRVRSESSLSWVRWLGRVKVERVVGWSGLAAKWVRLGYRVLDTGWYIALWY